MTRWRTSMPRRAKPSGVSTRSPTCCCVWKAVRAGYVCRHRRDRSVVWQCVAVGAAITPPHASQKHWPTSRALCSCIQVGAQSQQPVLLRRKKQSRGCDAGSGNESLRPSRHGEMLTWLSYPSPNTKAHLPVHLLDGCARCLWVFCGLGEAFCSGGLPKLEV